MAEPWMTREVVLQFEKVEKLLRRALESMGYKGWEIEVNLDDLYLNVFDGYTSGQIEMTEDKNEPFNACMLNEIPPTQDVPPEVEIVWDENYTNPYDCVSALLGKMVSNTIQDTLQEIWFDDTLPEHVEVM